MISWHYTTGDKYELIKKSGLLLPADIGISPPERPILWFSTHPRYEPTALKPLCGAQSKIWRGLAKTATKVNASQSDWWGHVGTVEIAELTVELMSKRMTWLPEDA